MEPVRVFIECLLPITACNFKCHYCYVPQRHNRSMKMASLPYSPAIIARGLRKERLGGAAYISICGAGETLMQKEMIDIMKLLLQEGHYVNVTTNGTINLAFKRMSEDIPHDLLKRVNISFSLHYLELLRLKMVDRFFDNIKFVRNLGCSVVVQLNLTDKYEPYLDEIKHLCMERIGALPQLAATRDEINLHKDIRLYTEHSPEEYLKIGREFSSPLFDFTMKNFMVKRKEFCYAGKRTYVLNLSTGILKPCYASNIRQNIFKDTESPIKLTAIGCHCRSPFCMNSSHFMSLGVIPSIDTPSYEELRNRKCSDGSEWYNPTMKEALSHHFKEYNDMKVDRVPYYKQFIKDSLISGAINIIPYSIKMKLKAMLKHNKAY